MKVMTPEHSLIDLAENPLDRSKIKSCFKDEKNLFWDLDVQESHGKSEETVGD